MTRMEALDPRAACKIVMSFPGARAHRISCRATPGMQMTQNVTRRDEEGKGEGPGEERGEGGGGGGERGPGGKEWID